MSTHVQSDEGRVYNFSPLEYQRVKPEAPTRPLAPWQIVAAIITFLTGSFSSTGLNWVRKDDSQAQTIIRLEAEVKALTDKYVVADKDMAQEVQKIEDHLSYDDSRIVRLEAELGYSPSPRRR